MVKNVDDPWVEATAHFLAASSLLVLGEPEEAERHAAASLVPAERVNNRTRLASVFWVNILLSQAKGDWDSARRFADRGMEPAQDPRLPTSLAVVEHETGDFQAGETYLQKGLEVIANTPPGPTLEHAHLALSIPAINRISGGTNHLDLAESSGQAVVANSSSMPMFKNLARAGLGLMAVLRDDASAARAAYAELDSTEGQTRILGFGATGRLLGLLAQTSGQPDVAAEHFEEALAFCRKAGYRPDLAWTCCDYADTLRERDSDADRAKAITLYDESLAISSELGMRPLMERVLSRREILRA